MGKFRPIDTIGCKTYNSVVITAAVTAGMALKSATGGVEAATDGLAVVGFAAADAAVGETVAVWGLDGGIFEGQVVAAVDLAPEAKIAMAAAQEIDAGTADDPSMGRIVDFNPASGALANFRFDPWATATI